MAKYHHACNLSFLKNEHLHSHMSINKVANSFCCFHTTTSSSLTPIPPCCPLPPLPSSSTVDHITAQVCHQPWLTPGATSLAPSMPLPSLKDVGVLTPPQHPCHNDNANATTSTTSMTMTTPCYQPPPLLECHISKKEEMR